MFLFCRVMKIFINLLLFVFVKQIDCKVMLTSPANYISSTAIWGEKVECPANYFVTKVMIYTGSYSADKTGLSGLEMECTHFEKSSMKTIISSLKGRYAKFDNSIECEGFANGFQLRNSDDSYSNWDKEGATAIRIHCSKGDWQNGYAFGSEYTNSVWSEKQLCPVNNAICFFEPQIDDNSVVWWRDGKKFC